MQNTEDILLHDLIRGDFPLQPPSSTYTTVTTAMARVATQEEQMAPVYIFPKPCLLMHS